MRWWLAWTVAVTACGSVPAIPRTTPPTVARDYLVFVASEATDDITLLRFGADGVRVERTQRTGFIPTEPDGPHGLGVSPDGATYFVTTAHGSPNGYLWKYRSATGELLGTIELGAFP